MELLQVKLKLIFIPNNNFCIPLNSIINFSNVVEKVIFFIIIRKNVNCFIFIFLFLKIFFKLRCNS